MYLTNASYNRVNNYCILEIPIISAKIILFRDDQKMFLTLFTCMKSRDKTA